MERGRRLDSTNVVPEDVILRTTLVVGGEDVAYVDTLVNRAPGVVRSGTTAAASTAARRPCDG